MMRNVAAGITAVAVMVACSPGAGTVATQKNASADANVATPVTYPDLSLVSAVSPFSADCNGPNFPITSTYVNAESEPYVARNPRNLKNLVAVYHEDRFANDGANGVLASTSFDGGRTWQTPALAHQPTFSRCAGGDVSNGGDFEKASDPWVQFGADGTAYFAAVSWNVSNPEVAQFVSTSSDGGRTWERPVAVIRAKDPNVSNASRPALTADRKNEKTMYVVWAQSHTAPAAAPHGSIGFSRTTDGGKTWSAARAIYDAPAGMQTSANEILVMPNGDLLNMFTEMRIGSGSGEPRRDRISFIRSNDGGLNWSRGRFVRAQSRRPEARRRYDLRSLGRCTVHQWQDHASRAREVHRRWSDMVAAGRGLAPARESTVHSSCCRQRSRGRGSGLVRFWDRHDGDTRTID